MGRTSFSLVDRIRASQKSVQANRRCADCFEVGPTYICLDFHTFVCQSCSGIHREFGHKVRGIALSDWTVQEVEAIERGGNELAINEWLARWSQAAPEGVEHEHVREFLRLKYVEKRWRRRCMSNARTTAALSCAGSLPSRSSSLPPERQDLVNLRALPGNSAGDIATISAGHGVPPSVSKAQHHLFALPRPCARSPADFLASSGSCTLSHPVSDVAASAAANATWRADFAQAWNADASSDMAAEEASRAEVGKEGETKLGERLRRTSIVSSSKDAKNLFQGDDTAPPPSREDDAMAITQVSSPSSPVTSGQLTSPCPLKDTAMARAQVSSLSSPATPSSPSQLASVPSLTTAPVTPCQQTAVTDQGQGSLLQLDQEEQISPEDGSPPAEVFYIGDDDESSLIGVFNTEVADVETLASELVLPPPASTMADLKDSFPMAEHLQQMSPQELLQMQQLISQTLKARAKAPSAVVQISFREQAEVEAEDAFTMPPAEFGDLVDVFRDKNIVDKHYGWI